MESMTLYQCSRCGYRLLTDEETSSHMAMPAPQKAGRHELHGQVLYVRVCKSEADCARRMKDQVAGKSDFGLFIP